LLRTCGKKLSFCRLITNTGEVANRFARMIPVPDGKADTITAAILSWLQEKGLDLNNLKGFGSDGASVMTGGLE